MSIKRYAAKRDGNEKPILLALRSVGAFVKQLSDRDLPDLAVFFRGRWFMLEVKTPKGRLTAGQKDWDQTIAPDTVIIVRSPEEALRAIGAID